MINIYNKNLKYKHINRLILNELKKNKKLLPQKLMLGIFSNRGKKNATGIQKDCSDDRLYWININLWQLMALYKGNKSFGRKFKYLKKIKSFKKFIKFTIYHELAHYKFRHCYLVPDNIYKYNIAEYQADDFAFSFIKKG